MVEIAEQGLKHFMLEALAISKKALPACRPNPPVGCVIVANGQIVASGYTQIPGARHAEIMAIDNCPLPLAVCQIFVTLEPCSFVGRTPACAATLIDNPPSKIYVAIIDPDPRNNGKGIQMLKAAGIDVELGLAATEVLEFLKPHLL